MKYYLLALTMLISIVSCTQIEQKKEVKPTVNKKDSTTIKNIFTSALTQGECYQNLDVLANNIGYIYLKPNNKKIIKIIKGKPNE